MATQIKSTEEKSKTRNPIFGNLLSRYSLLIALLLLIAFNGIMNPVFLKPINLFNILRQISFIGTLGVGMTLVIISGGIDLSVGSMTAFVGGLMILILNAIIPDGDVTFVQELTAVLVAVAAGIIIAGILGYINGFLISKGRITPFIVTLGGMAIYRSLCLFFADGGEYRSQSDQIYGHVGMDSLWFIPYPVIIWAVVALLCHIILSRTRYGRYVYAIGSNEQAVRYSAINVTRIKLITYTIMGLCCGISALLLSSRMNSVSSSGAGLGYELDAIAAVIIGGSRLMGGKGKITGTILGVIVLGVINNMLNMLDISTYLQGTVKGLIIIGAVLMQQKKILE